ncbi:MAG: hypothetical protein WBC97_11420 [Gemmatimonadales bacterium]
MARGLMRWPAVVGATCLAVMFGLYRTAPVPGSGHPLESWRHRYAVSDSLRHVERSIDSLELRADGARRSLSLGQRSQGFSVVDQSDSVRTRPVPDSIGRLFDSAWARQPARDRSIRVLIRVGGGWRYFPHALDDTTCVESAGSFGRVAAWEAEESLGACGYYAAFGRPGLAIGRWFTGSIIGNRTDPPGWRPAPDSTNWAARARVEWADGGWALRVARAGVPPSYEYSTDLARCAAGHSGDCADAALAPLPPHRIGWFDYFSYFGSNSGIGPLAIVLLPDLVHDFGADRFRAFWKSPEAAPIAFERTFGVSLDTWVRGEVIAYYGPLQLGAGDLGHSAISALIWALIFLGLTALMARRLRY